MERFQFDSRLHKKEKKKQGQQAKLELFQNTARLLSSDSHVSPEPEAEKIKQSQLL